MILLCCFLPFWDLGGCGLGLERLIGFLLYSDLNLKIRENTHRGRQLHLSRESPKHGLNMCSREELLVSVCPEPTWDLNRWGASCGKLQTLYMGKWNEGIHFFCDSPVTHHYLLVSFRCNVETPVVPSLLCISSYKETRKLTMYLKGVSTMESEGKQHH